MVKKGKLFCFIGAGLFLLNAIIFFAFHASIPVLLGIASVFVAIAILALALIPWQRSVLDIVSIVVSFVSAYLLTRAIRQAPTAAVVPSNLLVFCGFLLVLAGGVLEIRWEKNSPSTKKRSKSAKGDYATEDRTTKKQKAVKTKTPKIKKKKNEFTPLPSPVYNLNNNFEYEPEVIQFVEYLKKENSHLLDCISRPNIKAFHESLNIQCKFVDLPNYKPNRETVMPYFFVHMMKWVMYKYKEQHLDDKYLSFGMDFAISFEKLHKNGKSIPIMKLTVDSFPIEAIANSLIKDDIVDARVQFHDKWHASKTLTYDNFASNRAWIAYKKDKDSYEKYCNNLDSSAFNFVCNHTLDVIAPIAERLYNSLNIHHTELHESRYVVDKLVVEVGSVDGIEKIANPKTFLK